MAVLRTFAPLLLLTACGAAPLSELPPDVVLRYGFSHFEGGMSFEVKKDGSAVQTTSGGVDEDTTVRGKVTPEELANLSEKLRSVSFCSLTSSRSEGVPDEARPSIRVRLEELDCNVTLWDLEWHDDADAKAGMKAVDELRRALEARNPR